MKATYAKYDYGSLAKSILKCKAALEVHGQQNLFRRTDALLYLLIESNPTLRKFM